MHFGFGCECGMQTFFTVTVGAGTIISRKPLKREVPVSDLKNTKYVCHMCGDEGNAVAP